MDGPSAHRPPPARAPDVETGRGPPSTGFTLIEVVVTLAILGALAAAILPLAVQQRTQERRSDTRSRLRAVHDAAVGTPASFGSESDRSFGFLGDIGELPDSLLSLQRQAGLPDFQVDARAGIGAGWRGPYLPDEMAADSADVRQDAFGHGLRYSTASSTVGGLTLAGRVTSVGSDGQFGTDDDIVSPLLRSQVRSEVHGFLVSAEGQPFASAPIGLVFRNEGVVKDTVLFTDDNGEWAITGIPLGTTVALVQAGGGQGSGFLGNSSVISQENFTNQEDDVGFSVANVTSEPLTLSTLVVELPEETRDLCYRQASVDGRLLMEPGASEVKCDGDTLNIEPAEQVPPSPTAAGSGSRRRFTVHRPVEIAPELAISFGEGDVSRSNWQLLNWHDDGGTGNKVDMRGIKLTITFNDGLSHTFTVRGTQ